MTDLQIPKLPGYTVHSPNASGTSHAKRQTLKYLKGYATEAEPGVILVEEKKSVDRTGFPTGHYVTTSMATQGVESPSKSTLPRWVEYDQVVLRFFGYFKEAVDESYMENHRIRKIVLQFYTTDGTIQVIEPKQDNSGIPQGTFVKRHRIEKREGGFVNATELVVGEEVEFYGRCFFLVDCDNFTREFMAREYGIEQRDAIGYPNDPYDMYRDSLKPTGPPDNDVKTYVEAMLGKATNVLNEDKLRQFMDYSRKVLRFYCIWDDRDRLYGDRRPYVLHYFLEDDTVEILEVNENNCGRDPFPQFLKRARLPKGMPVVPDVTVKPKKEQCYAPMDFRIGGYVSVYGRPFFIHDCDEFTRFFYVQSMGYDEAAMVAINVEEKYAELPKNPVPPHNGFGSFDDTKQNCISLLPKPPARDFAKLMNKDKMILRFKCRMVETARNKLSNADKDRRFVLSYFLSDDTISIYEPPVRNSGIIGGKFLERQKVYYPQSTVPYSESDLFVGNQIDIFNRLFELVDADEYSFQYMENNKHIYVRSDIDVCLQNAADQIMGKEEDIRSAYIEADSNGTGEANADVMQKVFERCFCRITRQELLTIIRHIKQEEGSFNFDKFVAAVSPRR